MSIVLLLYGLISCTTRKPVFSLCVSCNQAVRLAERNNRVCIE